MSHLGVSRSLAGTIVLALAATAQAQDEGVKRVEQLVKKAGSTV